MARSCLSVLVLLSIFFIFGSIEPAVAGSSRARAFVEASCRRTLYPVLCIKSLSGFANKTNQSPQKLAQIALSVSLVKAQQTRAFLLSTSSEVKGLHSWEHQGLRDCLDQINDSVEQLRQSIQELQRVGQVTGNGDPLWQLSNAATWVSTAITDAHTCIDGFSAQAIRGKMRATVKTKVLSMVQHTSNALALLDSFASRYRATKEHRKYP